MLAVVVARGLELVHVQTDTRMDPAERWATLPSQVHVLGALTVWPFVAVLLALTGSLWATALLTLAAGGFIAVADYQKMRYRAEPLFPTDVEYLTNPGLLLDSAGISRPLAIGCVLLVVAGLAAGAVVAWRRRHRRRGTGRWYRWGARGLFGVAGVVGIVLISGFHGSGNPLKAAYDDIPAMWATWDQVQNYAQNGFVAGALYNLPGPTMERPEGYGRERMEQLLATYEQVAVDANAGRAAGALEDTNVLIVLGETFSDPTWLSGVEVAEDPIPFTRSLMEHNPSGRVLGRSFGGGTATAEFELLTGMSVANLEPQMHSPFPQLLPHHREFPSFVRSLAPGHGTLAIHPYEADFYRRDAAYPSLGFDRATFRDDMHHHDRIAGGSYISDAATYAEALDELRASPDPLVLNVVTMQNHTPYAGVYPDPIGVSGDLDAAEAEELGQYLRGLRHSDDALAELVTELEIFEERTVVLLYGDHLPSSLPSALRTDNPQQRLRETPWFVWANFETAEVQPPPVLGPHLLVPQLLAATDAPLSPYTALLTELSREVASQHGGYLLDAQGNRLKHLSPRAQELLDDYRLAQYDLSVGERYVAEELLAVP